ncbi:hypothetical protein Dvina_12115 [Dactylosporangium vinaceum]|uniref:Secreted protein with PEP-CTERM sorting signal n=1 Tax=Dactylosporangium vinaceum TaxID=53362 RepID=A0ABV5MFG5_9ACTN|nr:hypothetical protein [Dactylosporangium vinaceum]UAB98748.1 hypothetical protein Dvina_12115 [Dactylosporangium vinaceum]
MTNDRRTTTLLWAALAVAAGFNAALSTVNPILGAVSGVAVLACAGALIMRHVKARRRQS